MGPSAQTTRETLMARDTDEVAIERYRYLLRTAPPEEIEKAHAEAFTKLTPDQRARVLDGLAAAVPEAELREPGTMERAFGRLPARGGLLGGMGFGGTFLPTLAGAFVGTMIAQSLFESVGYPDGDPAASDAQEAAGGAETDEASAGDADSRNWDGDDGGADFGADAGDMGGGDFGD